MKQNNNLLVEWMRFVPYDIGLVMFLLCGLARTQSVCVCVCVFTVFGMYEMTM